MPVSVERFLQALAATGIMTADEVQSLTQSLPVEKYGGDADELAHNLVREGKLTRFQAAAIYQDKSDGLLLGNYLILDRLGAGGMGQVFRARHRRMDRVVALKVLAKKLLDSPYAVARFQREAKAAARLAHPNIVTAYDADEASGMHFLVMEYVDGVDLAGLVKKQGILPVSQALDYLLQATRGLEHAHELGVVHRDIKPSNLLVDKKGVVKILDMGLARVADPLADPQAAPAADLTQTGSIMGTIDYMSPEQAMDSRQADARSDLYSLGCTFHYLLTGRPPFSGDTLMKRLTAHQQAAAPILSTMRPDISPAVDQLFARLVAKQPEARFQTAKELAAAIETLGKEPAAARPVVPVAAPLVAIQPVAVPVTTAPSGVRGAESILLPGIEPGSRKGLTEARSRLPLVAVAVAVAVVLLLVAAGGGAWAVFRSKPQQMAQTTLPFRPGTEQMPSPEATPATLAAADQPHESAPPAAANESTAPQPAKTAPVKAMPAKAKPEVIAPAAAPPIPPTSPPVVAPPSTPAPSSVATSSATASPSSAGSAAPAAPSAEGHRRLPVPSAEAQRASLELIKELYKEEYAQAKQPEAKAQLAQRLLDESTQAKDDATAWYVVVHAACELAIDAADPELVERAIDMLSRRFVLAPLDVLASALAEMAAKPHPADTNRSIANAALARIDEAQEAEDFEAAKRFADVAALTARKAKDPALAKTAVEAGKSLAAARQHWDAWQNAREILAKDADDPAANLAAGRYLCFVQGQWAPGMAHLAKGSEGPLQELAAASLKPADEPAAQAELGDAWLAAADKAKGKDKADLRAGAAYWYTLAEPGMSGLPKAMVEKRLAELGGKISIRAMSSQMPVANGLSLPETFDCQSQSYPLVLGPTFDLGKSWTLKLGVRLPKLGSGSHMIFYWGDRRNGHNPMALSQEGAVLHVLMSDCKLNIDHEMQIPLDTALVGQWLDLVVRFDAVSHEFAIYLNGRLAKQEPAKVTPNFDRPMPLSIGADSRKKCRFLGQVRNVWLGNQDDFLPPGSKASLASIGLRPRIKNTLDVAAQTASGAAAPGTRTAPLIKSGDQRQVALWALGIKATVMVGSAAGEPKKIPDPSALPAGPITIVELRLNAVSGLDEASLPLHGLPSLKKLWLNGNTIGDVGLSQLTDLAALEELNVSGCHRITDRSMPALAKLTSLNSLVLNSAQVTDHGLAELKSLVSLKHFAAVGTHITGSGFAHWAPSDVLTNLNVANSLFDNVGVGQLRRFSRLDSLDLSKTRVTDHGVVSLAGNVNLRSLYLRETTVSETGLEKLTGLTGLKTLLVGPLVSEKGILSLRQALPGCRVDR